MKRLLVAVLVLPLVGGALVVRPAAAVGPGYDQVSLTGLVAGVRTGGLVGASGGLVTLDSASAYVTGRLDDSPSSQVLAAPYEPGTLARTVVGDVNTTAGTPVAEVPDAQARYPGAQTSQTLQTAPAQAVGPLALGAGSATARAGERSASGTAVGGVTTVTGALEVGPSTGTLLLSADRAAATVRQTASSVVSKVVVAGVLELDDLVATVTVSADGDRHAAAQQLTVGGASVAGQAVVVGNDGVTAAGTPLLPGQTLADATATVSGQLAAAGITVHTVGGRTSRTGRSAAADSGGIAITLATPALPGGVSDNVLSVLVGGVSLTELDTLPLPALPAVTAPQQPVARPPTAGRTVTTFIPGSPAVGAAAGPVLPALPAQLPPPQVAATAPLLTRGLVVQGRRVSPQLALLGLAAWQLFTLGTATLYAFVERRRRLVLLGRSA